MILAAALVWAQMAWAVPTRIEAYRNDTMGVVVYKDSTDPEVFWYLPIVRLYEQNGVVQYRKRTLSTGDVAYTLYLLPEFPDDLVDFVANEIPGLHSRQQLKPVVAKKFGIQVRLFNALAVSDDVTDYRYLNQPQLVRLTLNADQAADFEDLFTASPGVPANVVVYYDSERVDKYLSIELSYKEVYNAMNISASGRYTFTRAEIESNVSKYLSNKYLTIRSKGDIKMPEIVEKVITECFTPVQRPAPRTGGSSGSAPQSAQLFSTDARESLYGRMALLEEIQRETPAPSDQQLLDADKDDGAAPTPTPSPRGELSFTFKRELANRDEKFLYYQEEMKDAQEIAVLPAYLVERPRARPAQTVIPLPTRNTTVPFDASAARPYRTGITVQPGDQWTINAAFSLAALSPYANGEIRYYRWEPTWASPDGDLYFRVGSGPWRKVNGRAMVGAGVLQPGELQLYIDRATIWNKIPEDMRKSSMLGTVPAIFPYASTFPEFHLTLSGRRVSRQ